LGLLTLALGSLLDEHWLGLTFEGQGCAGGLKKKNKKVLGFRGLEDDPYG